MQCYDLDAVIQVLLVQIPLLIKLYLLHMDMMLSQMFSLVISPSVVMDFQTRYKQRCYEHFNVYVGNIAGSAISFI